MSIEHDITAASNQRDALIILGRAFDEQARRFDEAFAQLVEKYMPADPWDTWQPVATRVVSATLEDYDEPDTAAAEDELRRQIAAAEARLAATNDSEEIQAISAELRLLRDTGKPMGEYVPQGARAAVSSDGTTGDVVLAPADPERQAERHAWAMQARLGEFIEMDNEAAAHNFALGGPMWLYLGNRPAVMALGYAQRQWLVSEIELDSQAQAQEVGRDILKSEASVDKDIALHAIEAISDSRG